jgi:hypothetical protein
VESNLGNEAAWIAHIVSDMRNVVTVRDEKGRIGVKTMNKVAMVSRLQYLLTNKRLVFSHPFAVLPQEMHGDPNRTPEDRVKNMLSTQMCAMRRITTDPTTTVAVRTTISGKGDGNRSNDDLCMAFILGTHAYQKMQSGVYHTAAVLRFTH